MFTSTKPLDLHTILTMENTTLDEIARKHGTDKSSKIHNFMNEYEKLFAPLRHEPITFLEIGVWYGASLRTWREYFTNAKIDCADANTDLFVNVPPKIDCYTLDQKIESTLEAFASMAPKYDVILDDGNHQVASNLLTFKHLWPLVKPGGTYVIEDVHTSNDPNYNKRGCTRTTLDMVKALDNGDQFSVSDREDCVVLDGDVFEVIRNQIVSWNLIVTRPGSMTLVIKKVT